MSLEQRLSKKFEAATKDTNADILSLRDAIEFQAIAEQTDRVGGHDGVHARGEATKTGISGYLKRLRDGTLLHKNQMGFTVNTLSHTTDNAGTIMLNFWGSDLNDLEKPILVDMILRNTKYSSNYLPQSGNIVMHENDLMNALICWRNAVNPEHEFSLISKPTPEAIS